MINDEGLENVILRHHLLANATHAAVSNGAKEVYCPLVFRIHPSAQIQ